MSDRQARLIEECRARAAKRHKRIRSRAGKRQWKAYSKRKKYETIKRLYAVCPLPWAVAKRGGV